MKTQSGVTPRPSDGANRIIVPITRLGLLLACLALPAATTTAQSPAPTSERLNLFAQAQKAAAQADAPADTPAAPAPTPTPTPTPAPAAPATPAAPAAPAADPSAPAPAAPGGPGGRGGFGPGGARPGFGPGSAVGAATDGAGGLVQGPGGRVTLQFPLNPVSDLLNIYERLIAKTIVKDTTVFDGPQVSLVTPGDVDRTEAIRLIEATLLVNGYVIVAEPDLNSVKVLFGGPRQGGQSASFSEGIVIYSADDPLPSGETLVGYYMELENISPETAATLFGNHVVLNQFGRITPVTTPRGLLITESSSIIRQLIQLKKIIDVSAEDAPLLTEFIKLQFAEANVVAQIIQAAMDARMEERQRQGESGRTVSGQRPAAGNQPTPTQSQPSSSQTSSSSTTLVRTSDGRTVAVANKANSGIGTADMPAAQLIPDDRLNRIMVVASPTDLAYVIEMIEEFDQPLDNPDPVERPLNHVKANDVLPVVVDVLQDTGTGQTQLPGGRQIDTRPTPVTSSQLATLTGVSRNSQNQQNRNTGAAETDSTSAVGGRTDQIAFPIDDVAPLSVLVGKTRLIADRQNNSIIIIGSKENQQIVLDIIDRLDRKPLQVYLATVIGELTLTDDVEFGVDYLQKFIQFDNSDPSDGGVASSLINSRDELTTSIADLRDSLITTPFGPASGLNVYGQIGESLDVIVTALEKTENFKVLSRPVVYTQNGKRAEITSGQEVPYPESSLSDTNNPNSIRSTVAYKDVVLKLEVLPTINENNEVTLDVVQINDRIVGEQLVDTNLIPIIGKQELNTTVTIPNRSTIVLGGLISERDGVSDAGVPFLKNIPILGNAVKNTAKTKERTELMIFIQPIVVREDTDAFTASHDEDVRSDIGVEAARIFPEPTVPTLQNAAEETIEIQKEERRGFIGRLGQRIIGKKPIGEGRPVIIDPLPTDPASPEIFLPGAEAAMPPPAVSVPSQPRPVIRRNR
jgi:general secretion pathway protein D